MAGRSKKVGGIKKVRPKAKGRTSPRAKKKVGGVTVRPDARPLKREASSFKRTKKKVGGVRVVITEAASSKHRYCMVGCEGDWREGMWCHDNTCAEVRMIWKAHGQRREDWTCFYGCPGETLPSGWTHHRDCKFWSAHPELTPFHTQQEEEACTLSLPF